MDSSISFRSSLVHHKLAFVHVDDVVPVVVVAAVAVEVDVDAVEKNEADVNNGM